MFQVVALAPSGYLIVLPDLYTKAEANVLMDSLARMGFSNPKAYGSSC